MRVEIIGEPSPQGSKRLVGGRMIEASNKVKPWRESVKYAIAAAMQDDLAQKLMGPVFIRMVFHFVRPAHHYGKGRNAGKIKASAPPYPAMKPDLDKLVRSTLDAIVQAGAMADDAQVVCLHAMKVYAERCGAIIELSEYGT